MKNLIELMKNVLTIIIVITYSTVLFSCKEQKSEKKNVLFISIDDLRPYTGSYGALHLISPTLDSLASQGIQFNRAYCEMAMCTPSRASVLTGLRATSTGVEDLYSHFRLFNPHIKTLPQVFKENGYTSISLGKVFHFSDHLSWSEPEWHEPLENLRGYLLPHNIEKSKTSKWRQADFYEAADVEDNAYGEGMVAEKAIKKLDSLANTDNPFFLAVGFFKPHLPFLAPKKYWDMYTPEQIKYVDSIDYVVESPAYVNTFFGELTTYTGFNTVEEEFTFSGKKRAVRKLDEESKKKMAHGYQACITYVDYQIRKITNKLKELGLEENTIIAIWGDHGWILGEHNDWCKQTNFEVSTRAPLIIIDPSMTNKGIQTNAIVEFVDIYPTICDIAGIEKPNHLEGISTLPLFEDPVRPWKKAAFSRYLRDWVNEETGQWHDGLYRGLTVRTDSFRYTEWHYVPAEDSIAAIELYDHVNDPGETKNVVGESKYKQAVRRHQRILADGWENALPKYYQK